MFWTVIGAISLFWKLMIAAASLVAFGWVAYGIWDWIETRKEKALGKIKSTKLEKAEDSMSDFEKQMAKFQKKTYTKDELNG